MFIYQDATDITVAKLAGLNERLDDMLLELGELKNYMPDEDDLENLQKYNKAMKLKPMPEDKKKQKSDQQSDANKKNA